MNSPAWKEAKETLWQERLTQMATEPWEWTELVACGPRTAEAGEPTEEWADCVVDEAQERHEAWARGAGACPCCRQALPAYRTTVEGVVSAVALGQRDAAGVPCPAAADAVEEYLTDNLPAVAAAGVRAVASRVLRDRAVWEQHWLPLLRVICVAAHAKIAWAQADASNAGDM